MKTSMGGGGFHPPSGPKPSAAAHLLGLNMKTYLPGRERSFGSLCTEATGRGLSVARTAMRGLRVRAGRGDFLIVCPSPGRQSPAGNDANTMGACKILQAYRRRRAASEPAPAASHCAQTRKRPRAGGALTLLSLLGGAAVCGHRGSAPCCDCDGRETTLDQRGRSRLRALRQVRRADRIRRGDVDSGLEASPGAQAGGEAGALGHP